MKLIVKSQPNVKKLLKELEELYGIGNVTISIYIHDKNKDEAKEISRELASCYSMNIEHREGIYKIRDGLISSIEFNVFYRIDK